MHLLSLSLSLWCPSLCLKLLPFVLLFQPFAFCRALPALCMSLGFVPTASDIGFLPRSSTDDEFEVLGAHLDMNH